MKIKEQTKGDGWEYSIFTMEPSDVERISGSTEGYLRVERLTELTDFRRESWLDDMGVECELEYECPDNVRTLALSKCDTLVAEVLSKAATTVQWQAPISFKWSTRSITEADWLVCRVFMSLDRLSRLPDGPAWRNERAYEYAELRHCLKELG